MKNEDRLAHNSVPIRLAILGHRQVGKSALTVRYLTKRFIGEYRSDTDILYKCKTLSEGICQPHIELMDTSTQSDVINGHCDVMEQHLIWGDAFVIVYSICDQESFKWAAQAIDTLKSRRPGSKIMLIANKSDLSHLREVDEMDGRYLAMRNSCRFTEVSSAECVDVITSCIDNFLRDVKESKSKNMCSLYNSPPKQKKISVSKMIGYLIGKTQPSAPITELIVLDRTDFLKMKPSIRHL